MLSMPLTAPLNAGVGRLTEFTYKEIAMRIIRLHSLLVAALLVWLPAFGNSGHEIGFAQQSRAVAGHDAANDTEFRAMLVKLDAAQQEFHNGRPDALKAIWSHADDVTLAGGSGGAIEKGWEHVSRRLDWASSQYTKGVQTNERITVKVSGDFAYVVQLEHIRFHVPGQEREATRDYRITMVFRREAGSWRLVHRQADTQMTAVQAR